MKPILNTNLAQHDMYMIRIRPPAGKKFRFTYPDPELYYVRMLLNLGRIIIHSHDGATPTQEIPPLTEIFGIFATNWIDWVWKDAKIHFINMVSDGKMPYKPVPKVYYFHNAVGIALIEECLFYSSATFDEIQIDGLYAPPFFSPDAFFDYYPAAGMAGKKAFLIPDPHLYFEYPTNAPLRTPEIFVHII